MAELKTKKTQQNPIEFLETVSDENKKQDSLKILNIMKEITKEKPAMWGSSIIGFGKYQYKYASGRDAEWFLTGFSPRKQNLTLYIMPGFEKYQTLLDKLGKHKTGKSCLYIKKLQDIDIDILKQLIQQSVTHLQEPKK